MGIRWRWSGGRMEVWSCVCVWVSECRCVCVSMRVRVWVCVYACVCIFSSACLSACATVRVSGYLSHRLACYLLVFMAMWWLFLLFSTFLPTQDSWQPIWSVSIRMSSRSPVCATQWLTSPACSPSQTYQVRSMIYKKEILFANEQSLKMDIFFQLVLYRPLYKHMF